MFLINHIACTLTYIKRGGWNHVSVQNCCIWLFIWLLLIIYPISSISWHFNQFNVFVNIFGKTYFAVSTSHLIFNSQISFPTTSTLPLLLPGCQRRSFYSTPQATSECSLHLLVSQKGRRSNGRSPFRSSSSVNRTLSPCRTTPSWYTGKRSIRCCSFLSFNFWISSIFAQSFLCISCLDLARRC